MQIGTNPYFNLQDYSKYFKSRDIQQVSNETESQKTQINSIESQEKSEQNLDKTTVESPNGEELDASEQQYVRELAAIDASVRAHEAAHVGAGAGVVSGGASFGYTRGPDGKMYATSGEVPISMKEGRTPEETIRNARQIISAAMAPADPSPQDYKVAANAAQMESQARSEQAQERAEEMKEQLEHSDAQDSKEVNSSSNNKDSTTQNANNIESQNASNSNIQEKKPFLSNEVIDDGLVAYAIKSYTANATNHSYNPRLDIAG